MLSIEFILSLLTLVSIIFFTQNENTILQWLLRYCFLYQWFQVNIKLINYILTGTKIEDSFSYYQSSYFLNEALITGNLCLLLFMIGAFIRLRNISISLNNLISGNKTSTLLLLYSFLLTLGYTELSVFSSFHSILSVSASFRLVIMIMFLIRSFYARRDGIIAFIICGTEILIGLNSFFSDWKEPLIVILLIWFARDNVKLFSLRSVYIGFALIVIVVFWTAIKPTYRGLVAKDADMQVSVSLLDVYKAYSFSLASLDFRQIQSVIDATIDRISYIEFFSLVIDKDQRHFGYHTEEMFEHFLKPRIFYPNKKILFDSENTIKFTGVSLASGWGGSHSLGYVAQFFVDYGRFGSLIACALYGYLLSFLATLRIYRNESKGGFIIILVLLYMSLDSYSINIIKNVAPLLYFAFVYRAYLFFTLKLGFR